MDRAGPQRQPGIPAPQHGQRTPAVGGLSIMAAGNAAIGRLLGGQVRRCGPVPCDCDDEERLEYDLVHRHADSTAHGPADVFLSALAGAGTGTALPEAFRADAEAKFDSDFRSVRVHTDTAAGAAAESINANAFTVRDQIYFGPGRYQPGDQAGKRLLAHELTHVVQDGGPQASGDSWISHPHDPAERAAEAAADAFMAGAAVSVQPAAGSTSVHREQKEFEDVPAKVVRLIRAAGDREAILKACMEAATRWDDVQKEWDRTPSPQTLLTAAQNMSQGRADAARVYAYLRFGRLRLADKLFFAGTGAGTDKETIFRLLPAVHADAGTTGTEFTASYGTSGGTAFDAVYTTEGALPNNTRGQLAGFLDDELSGSDLVKAKAILAYGQVRPVDEVRMALQSTLPTPGSVMAALDIVHHGTPDLQKPPAEDEYKTCYGSDLRNDIRPYVGDRDWQRAQAILDGNFTPINRIRIACQALVVDTEMIWAALKDATPAQLTELKEQWAAGGEIKTLITGKLTISTGEANRVEAILKQGTAINDRLLAAGVEVGDTKGVVRAALTSPDFRATFAAEYLKHEDFYKDFTNDGRIATAQNWGPRLAKEDWKEWLGVAIEVESEEGVRGVLMSGATTDKARAEVSGNKDTMAKLRELSGWPTIEPLLAPRDDMQAKAKWLAERYNREKGLWGDTSPIGEAAASAAFGDEKRELDAALAKAADPANLTPDERKQIGSLAAGAEAALDDFIKVRDQLDAIAIQVVGAVAGLVATALTGGAAGPVTAGLLARVALAQGCAAAASVWVVKQERATGAEAARAFAVGAASGVTSTLTGSALKGLSQEVVDEATKVSKAVADQQFGGFGQRTMNAAMEGLAGNAVGGAIDTASRADTWRNGFIDGLGKTFESAAVGGLQGALTGAAAHLFTEAVGFARAGKVREANEKMNELEAKLTPEQAATLRSELNAQMTEKLGQPPGRAKVRPDEDGLLKGSGQVADGTNLKPAELTNELNVVGRSEPQPSTVDGYLDEVDLGNGHAWRRKPDGKWCRFSKASLCGTDIPGAPPPSAQTRSRGVRTLLARLESDMNILRSHPDAPTMITEFTAIERLLDAGDIDTAVTRYNALRKRVDVGLGMVGEGALTNNFGGDGESGTTTFTPTAPTNTGPPVALDANSPRPGDRTGQRLLSHVQDAIKRFNDESYTDAMLATLKQHPELAPAFRGSRIDEFAKAAVKADPELQHVIATDLYERGADFYDSRTGKWYDITTVKAWKDHVAKYGPRGARLPTETR